MAINENGDGKVEMDVNAVYAAVKRFEKAGVFDKNTPDTQEDVINVLVPQSIRFQIIDEKGDTVHSFDQKSKKKNLRSFAHESGLFDMNILFDKEAGVVDLEIEVTRGSFLTIKDIPNGFNLEKNLKDAGIFVNKKKVSPRLYGELDYIDLVSPQHSSLVHVHARKYFPG